jgi:hypothetical protein
MGNRLHLGIIQDRTSPPANAFAPAPTPRVVGARLEAKRAGRERDMTRNPREERPAHPASAPHTLPPRTSPRPTPPHTPRRENTGGTMDLRLSVCKAVRPARAGPSAAMPASPMLLWLRDGRRAGGVQGRGAGGAGEAGDGAAAGGGEGGQMSGGPWGLT